MFTFPIGASTCKAVCVDVCVFGDIKIVLYPAEMLTKHNSDNYRRYGQVQVTCGHCSRGVIDCWLHTLSTDDSCHVFFATALSK